MDENDRELIRELIDSLNYHNKLYNLGQSEISDAEWDKIYFQLQELEQTTGIIYPDSPTQEISYSVVNELQKVNHNHPMLSLGKTKDWAEFIQYFYGKSVIGMIKCDGLTCSLKYENGELISAETRGNGQVGEDITHNARVIKNIPQRINHSGTLIVDGEIICTNKDFEEFKDNYSNSRNFAAGSIRLLDSKECEKRKLKFIVWNVVTGINSNSFLDRLVAVNALGFTTVPWTSSFDWDAKEYLIETAENEGIPIDGLVGRFDDIAYGESLGATGHHSKAAFAFKFTDEEYDTTLLDIEWTMGRTGQITPVAIFEPVDDGDSIIERASLHNISVMKETLNGEAYKGKQIRVAKMNEIIPQITWADNNKPENTIKIIEIPSICPICGGATEIRKDNDSEILYCTNNECEGKLLNKIDHYCSKKGLEIKGLSKATIEKLIDWEWLTRISDLYKLKFHRSEWINKEGFGEKSVDNILQAIENSRTPYFTSFLSAIGIPMIGTTLSKEIVKYFNNYEEFRKAVQEKYDFTQIDKIAEEKSKAILNFDYGEADILNTYMLEYKTTELDGTSLAGHKIAITGKLKLFKNRDALVTAIENNGGKVVSSVSKNTTMLINNDNASASSKNLAAQKLGIPVITESDFFDLYLKN